MNDIKNTTSIATQIADIFEFGTCYELEDGTTLESIIDDRGGRRERCEDRGSEHLTRYEFDDGSAIVCCGVAWDVEGETPFLPEGV